MSLTSHLNSTSSPINQYFNTHFNFSTFLQEENQGLVGTYTIRPKSFDDYPWADMGHIVEYLLALHMGLPIEHLFPMRFAKKEYSQIFNSMKKKYDNFDSTKQKLHFRSLTDDLYKLSKIEAVYRNGNYIPNSTLQNLTSTLVMQDDLRNIYELSLSKNELLNNPTMQFSYNPLFELSVQIGGADADLYAIRKHGNYLLDLKTTVKPVVTNDMMFQLLGYVFLDKDNAHNFVDIGLYLPRQNLISEWNIEELIKKYSDFSTSQEAKEKFIDVIYRLKNSSNNKSRFLK